MGIYCASVKKRCSQSFIDQHEKHALSKLEVLPMHPKKVLLSIAYGLSVLLLLSTPQTFVLAKNQQSVSTVFAIVLKRLDNKTASVNQELSLRTISDVVVDGVVVIPSGSEVVAHVVEVATKGKESQKSVIAIVID